MLPPAGQTVAQVAVPLTAVVAVMVSVNKVTRAVDEKTSAVKKSVDEKKAAMKKSVEESPLGAASSRCAVLVLGLCATGAHPSTCHLHLHLHLHLHKCYLPTTR